MSWLIAERDALRKRALEAESVAQRLMGIVESTSLREAITEGFEAAREAKYYRVRYEELCPLEW